MFSRDTHGIHTDVQRSGENSPIASDQPSTMAWCLPTDAPTANIPPRPPLISQQSNSLPSTPYQHSRGLSFHSKTPSPRRRSTSPRSVHSETNPLPSFRRPLGGCKYETGMAFFRRRMPYSLGGDLLPEETVGLKEQLDAEEDERLTADIRILYDRLLPSAESDDRRRQLVQKLEKLFNEQWPGNDIKVHVFGSSGNKLCSSDSDVDICITTPYKELEHVCLLADVLANHGMERVVCVSHAKVPIVKIWDPQLKLACDMNVNNTLALENTRMIRTYVEMDERVRPLAMTVKYWTKRRVLNDAALGGTLSSYTWICLIINFLQTRDPPILPSLQRRSLRQHRTVSGVDVSFDDDLKSLMSYGRNNKQSLGDLLFQFFRYYGHEVNFEKHVISVREGKLISKEGKGWHLLQNNRLCVEEPFNTTRNLGNTADDTSFRGLHMELRRAFKAILEADLEKSCEQFIFPPEEERVWERPPPQPRPTLVPTPSHTSTRGGRGGIRGARHSNQYGRGGNTAGRRSSSATNRTNNGGNFRSNTFGPTPEMALQAQHAQYLLHDQLYQQIQILQAQEQELRMQLHNQSMLTGRPPPVLIRQPLIQFSFPQADAHADDTSRARAGTVNHPPLSAPLRPGMVYSPAYFPVPTQNVQGSSTNPPSPSLPTTSPEYRRKPRRSSIAYGSPGGSLRSQSQPARSMHSPVMQTLSPVYHPPSTSDNSQSPKERGPAGSPSRNVADLDSSLHSAGSPNVVPRSAYVEDHRSSDYVGYFLTPQQQAYQQSLMAMSLSGSAMSSYFQYAPDYRAAGFAYPEAFATVSDTATATATNTQAVSPPKIPAPRPTPSQDRGPLIIDGSVPPIELRGSIPGQHQERLPSFAPSATSDVEVGWDSPSRESDGLPTETQEPTTFELEGFPSTHRDGEGRYQSSRNDTTVSGRRGRLGGLNSQFQNFHVSNLDGPADLPTAPPRKAGKSDKTHGESPTKKLSEERQLNSMEGNTEPTASKPAIDSPTRSSTVKRGVNGLKPEKANGLGHKLQATESPSAAPDSSISMPQPASLPRKPDGLPSVPGGRDLGNAYANGGWQTTKKKHKRNAKSAVDAHHLNMVEPLPVDESLRKGG